MKSFSSSFRRYRNRNCVPDTDQESTTGEGEFELSEEDHRIINGDAMITGDGATEVVLGGVRRSSRNKKASAKVRAASESRELQQQQQRHQQQQQQNRRRQQQQTQLRKVQAQVQKPSSPRRSRRLNAKEIVSVESPDTVEDLCEGIANLEMEEDDDFILNVEDKGGFLESPNQGSMRGSSQQGSDADMGSPMSYKNWSPTPSKVGSPSKSLGVSSRKKVNFLGIIRSSNGESSPPSPLPMRLIFQRKKVPELCTRYTQMRSYGNKRLFNSACTSLFSYTTATTPPLCDLNDRSTSDWLPPVAMLLHVDYHQPPMSAKTQAARANSIRCIVATRDKDSWIGGKSLLCELSGGDSSRLQVVFCFTDEERLEAEATAAEASSLSEPPSDFIKSIFAASRVPLPAPRGKRPQKVGEVASVFTDLHSRDTQLQKKQLCSKYWKYTAASTAAPVGAKGESTESWVPPAACLVFAEAYVQGRGSALGIAKSTENHPRRQHPLVTILARDKSSWERCLAAFEAAEECSSVIKKLEICHSLQEIDGAFGPKKGTKSKIDPSRPSMREREGDNRSVFKFVSAFTPMR